MDICWMAARPLVCTTRYISTDFFSFSLLLKKSSFNSCTYTVHVSVRLYHNQKSLTCSFIRQWAAKEIRNYDLKVNLWSVHSLQFTMYFISSVAFRMHAYKFCLFRFHAQTEAYYYLITNTWLTHASDERRKYLSIYSYLLLKTWCCRWSHNFTDWNNWILIYLCMKSLQYLMKFNSDA